MRLAKRLISGVDIWLNTPTRPMEASGTSGEKAEMNGVLNFSVLDGWWYEGYREGAGWALTEKRTYDNQQFQDQLDAATIYSMLENEVIPLYYAKNSKGYSPEWIQYIKNSITQIAPFYTTKRMFDDYINRFYNKLASRSVELKKNSFAKAKEIVLWKENMASNWDAIEVIHFDYDEKIINKKIEIGDSVVTSLLLDKHDIKGDIGAELVRYHTDPQTGYDEVKIFPMQIVKTEGTKVYYELKLTASEAGAFKFGLRIFPDNKDLPHRMDFAYVRWLNK
jgi:starch phosphorylase